MISLICFRQVCLSLIKIFRVLFKRKDYFASCLAQIVIQIATNIIIPNLFYQCGPAYLTGTVPAADFVHCMIYLFLLT